MTSARRPLRSFLLSPERWSTLEPLLDAALDLAPEGRAAFYAEVGERDASLAKELEDVVAACERGAEFLSAGAMETFGDLLDQRPPEVLDECFVIESEIGRGGMATVYLARDKRHDRAVAVKVLGPEARAGIGVDRFLREIRVVAHLQHAHILPLYDSGDDGGWLYYVMPVINGGNLRDRIASERRLSLDSALHVAREIASALDHAHAQGIVHRDIKPENILFHDGRALLADFGIARAVERSIGNDTLTGVGVSVGTPGYMSPEQQWGGEVNARSDVYSLACVVYEMLTGALPLADSNHDASLGLTSVDVAAAFARRRSDVSPLVGEALRKALALEPNERFPTAVSFVEALLAPASTGPLTRKPFTRRSRWAVVAGSVVVFAAAFLIWRTLHNRSALRSVVSSGVVSIAVRPFDNISRRPEDDYLTDGVVDELTAALARIPGVSVVPRSSAIAYRNAGARAMGDSLHVAWVLEGTLSHIGTTLHVRPTLVNVVSGRIAWSGQYDRELADVIAVQQDMVRTIADTLRLTLLPTQAHQSAGPSENIDAYINYLKGRFYWNQRLPAALDTSIAYFKAALKYDSSYALAYSGLADAYSLRGWSGVPPRSTFPLARTAAERALKLDSSVAAAHASLGFVHIWYDWDWAAGQREIDRAIALDSTYASAVLFTAWYLIPHGRMEDAVVAAQRAQRLEPLSPIINARVGSILAYSHRFKEAETALRKTLETNPGFPIARAQLARLLAVTGRFPEAVAALPPDDGSLGSFEAGVRGFVYARAGNRDAALRQIQALEARPYQSPDAIAAIYTGLGDADQAFAWLEKAYQARAMTFVLFAVEPMYDLLHSDPRYQRLIARVGLREAIKP